MKDQLIWGDCLRQMPRLESKSVDMVLCDLPYGTTSVAWDMVIPFEPLWSEYKRIVKPGGAIVLFGSGIFTARLIFSNIKWYKYNLVWEKSKCGSPLLAKYRPMMKHEDIVVFSHGGGRHKTYNPQMQEGEPYARKNVAIKTNNHGYGLKQVTTDNKGTRHPSSVLKFPMKWRRQDQIHPTQKPIELCEFLIKSYSNQGEVVLDNCFGSGSALIAAKNLDRRFVGIELDIDYYNMAQKRIFPTDAPFSRTI